MGQEIIAWIDDRGKVCVAEAYCPHLGADFAPSAGGKVCAGRLVCPFHGYQFDTTGQCVATPYSDPPKTAKLQVFQTHEICGLIFGWWGIDGREPQWHLPENSLDIDGWSNLNIRSIRFAGHPQDTVENAVDLGHLRYVHGYDNISRADRLMVDGHMMTSNFHFKRPRTIAKVAKLTFDVTARTSIFGLGYSFVDIREHSIGMNMRFWVLATPVDGTLIDFNLASQVQEIRKPQRFFAGLGFLPTKWRAPIMNNFTASQQMEDVGQDVTIWENKEYRSRPRLCRSDGEIMPFRYWCAQFYRNTDDAAA